MYFLSVYLGTCVYVYPWYDMYMYIYIYIFIDIFEFDQNDLIIKVPVSISDGWHAESAWYNCASAAHMVLLFLRSPLTGIAALSTEAVSPCVWRWTDVRSPCVFPCRICLIVSASHSGQRLRFSRSLISGAGDTSDISGCQARTKRVRSSFAVLVFLDAPE